jgi:hypothetical protein
MTSASIGPDENQAHGELSCPEKYHYSTLGSLPLHCLRDAPFAQARFAEEAKLENIQYLSDYRSTGLLIDGPR